MEFRSNDFTCEDERSHYFTRVKIALHSDRQACWLIHKAATAHPMDEKEFARLYTKNPVIAVQWQGKILGYCIYGINGQSIDILDMATDPQYLRRKVGWEILLALTLKIAIHGRTKITALVREANRPALEFFKSYGGDMKLIRHAFSYPHEDGVFYVYDALVKPRRVTAEAIANSHHQP